MLRLNILESTEEERQMIEMAAAIYTHENSVPVIRNATSGMISEADHKGWTDPFGQEEKAQTWKWK